MIWLTKLDAAGSPPLSVDPEKIVGIEMIFETRGGVVMEKDGDPISVGSLVYVAGRTEPFRVAEHVPDVERVIAEARAHGVKITDYQGRVIREDKVAANPDIRDARPRE